jgi:4-cresol dehydrogenase (hydroxylating)
MKTLINQLHHKLNYKEQLISDKEILEDYAQNMIGEIIVPIAIYKANNTEQVVDLLKSCNELKIPVHVISIGLNWGYGACQGTQKNQLILELSKMDAVLEIDPELCYASIQPGVTQEILYKTITNQKLPLQMDATGAPKSASIVGNILERGFGHTEYGDRYNHIISLKVVLPDGSIIHTGGKKFVNSKTGNTYEHSLGPNYTGIFLQSNFGVVVEMTIRLRRRPKVEGFFVVSTKNDNHLSELVAIIRELKLEHVVNSTVHIANKSRVLGNTDKQGIVLGGVVTGDKALVKAKLRLIKGRFKNTDAALKIQTIKNYQFKYIDRLAKLLDMSEFHQNKYVFDLMRGIPTNMPLEILSGGQKHINNPRAIKEGFMWVNTLCPANERVKTVYQIVKNHFEESDFNFKITFTFVNPTTLVMITNIDFDKTKESIQKAKEFKNKLNEKLYSKGYYPYRQSNIFDNKLTKYISKEQIAFDQSIKNILDKEHIVSPNKNGIK